MKQLFFYALLTIFIVGCSSDDSDDNSSGTFTGTFDARLSGGFQNGVPATVNISQSNDDFIISIDGDDINPTIVLTAIQDSDVLRINPCSNMCYQGDANITDSGLVEIDNGKRRIIFAVYFPDFDPDETFALHIEVEEN